MPRPTYTFYARQCDSAPLQDGIAGLWNGSDRHVVEVREVMVFPAGGESPASQASYVALARCSAPGNGQVVTPSKHDTASATLPAQVTCTVSNNDDVTAGDVLTRWLDVPSFTAAGANVSMAASMPGAWRPGGTWQTADAFRAQHGSDVEPIVLREGEGLCVGNQTFGRPRASVLGLLVRVLATGATYSFRSRDVGTPRRLTQPQLVLHNAAGSGVVLQVIAVEEPSDGESILAQGIRLALIDGYDQLVADAPAVAHDSLAPLPAGVFGLDGPFRSEPAGVALGVPHDWATTHGSRVPLAAQGEAGRVRRVGVVPNGRDTASAIAPWGGWQNILYRAPRGSDGIRLRPGQGIAVLDGVGGVIGSSSFAFVEVSITFTAHEEAPPTYVGAYVS